MADEKHFRFLDISAELRNAIYEKTFEDTIVYLEWHRSAPPSILMANKQIYNEAVMLFYRHATFTFYSTTALIRWYTRIPPKFGSTVSCIQHWPRITTSAKELKGAIDMINRIHSLITKGNRALKPGVLQFKVHAGSGKTLWTSDPKKHLDTSKARLQALRTSGVLFRSKGQTWWAALKGFKDGLTQVGVIPPFQRDSKSLVIRCFRGHDGLGVSYTQNTIPKSPLIQHSHDNTIKQHTHLLDLPQKLCDSICELVSQTYPITLPNQDHQLRSEHCHPPSILLVSEEVYDDEILLFYQSTTFYLASLSSSLYWYIKRAYIIQDSIANMRFDAVQAGCDPLAYRNIFRKCAVDRDAHVTPGVLEVSVRSRLGQVIWTGHPEDLLGA
ncbi:hypothetical protein LTR37_003382 [Vermiconidia calcicola]|uniref:Uncharacterized protein n=1 Tax=Vermiconidia calcicola TaxID=1690605 RepID=A0ACC3NRY0_9PEZI|nr:hypothetical protein LTR37_003382 [Vermiconidia calcicola]